MDTIRMTIYAAIVLILVAFAVLARYPHLSPVALPLFSAAAAPVYDLDGDGIIGQNDLDMYREWFNKMDFDANGTIDIYDQVMLSYQVRAYNLYLPIVSKNEQY